MKRTDILEQKLFNLHDLQKQLNVWRFLQQKIVFTNGCFDLLHLGHVDYLCRAADLGDKLIVGLNSDDSVKKLKGTHRPINKVEARQRLLASLFFVNAVIVFEEDTPARLIEQVRPDFLVKGGDWKAEEIVGADFVKQQGGEVHALEVLEGYSTSAIAQKIQTD